MYISFGLDQVFDIIAGDRKNLKINILTKERNANFDIFFLFYKNFIKSTKTVLTAMAEKATDLFGSLMSIQFLLSLTLFDLSVFPLSGKY